MWAWIKRVSVAILAAGLVACGGGGDETSVSSSASGLNFEGYVGESIAPQDISVTLKEAPGALYVDYFSDNPSIASVNGYLTGPVSGVLQVFPSSFLSAGTYKTKIYLKLYSDPAGRSLVASYPYDITVVVRSGLLVSPSSVAMNARQGLSATANLVLTPPAGVSVSYSATISPGASPAPWLKTAISGNNLQLTATTTVLAPGAYITSLEVKAVRANGGSSIVIVPISLTVGPDLIAPARQTLPFDVNSSQSSLAKSVPVERGDGASVSWSATTTSPWLVLNPASGISPANLGFAVDLAQANSLAPFSDHTATVTVSAVGSALPMTFEVVLQQRVPFVSFVGPYGMPAGTSTKVIVGGRGFIQLTSPVDALQLSGLAATQVQVVSDTQISFNATPSSGGSYRVGIQNAAGMATTRASLEVAASHTYTSAIVPHAFAKEVYVHDSVRKAVFALSRNNNALYKYSLVGGSWSVSALAISQPLDMALAPDGRSLWIAGQSSGTGGRLIEVDPDAMTIRATLIDPGHDMTQGIAANLPITSNNRLWLIGGRYFDLQTRSFNSNPFTSIGRFDAGTLYGSLDGATAIFGPSWYASPRNPSVLYTPATEDLGPSSGTVELGYEPRVSADGSRLLLEYTGALYDRTFSLIGQLPTAPSNEWWLLMALMPDGKRIAVLRASNDSSTNVPLSIDVYSTQAFNPGTTTFVRTARIPITTNAQFCDPRNFDGCNYGNLYLLPSRDSSAVFWIGNQNMQVIPLP